MQNLIAILNKIWQWSTIATFCFFIFPFSWATWLIGVWALLTLLRFIAQPYIPSGKNVAFAIVLCVPFIIMTLFYYLHGAGDSGTITRQLSMLAFPLLSLTGWKNTGPDDSPVKLGPWFILASLLLFLKGCLLYFTSSSGFAYTDQHDFLFRFRLEFEYSTGIHPTYASMYMGVSVIICILDAQLRTLLKKWRWLVVGLLVSAMMVLSARMPLLATCAVIVVLWFTGWIETPFKRKRALLVMIVTGGIIGMGLLFFTRWGELIQWNKKTGTQPENTVNIRWQILTCDYELSKMYFLKGTGPQHVQKKLNQCYYQFEGTQFTRNVLNTHNQYADFLIGCGLAGLLGFLITLITAVRKGIHIKNPVYLSFIAIVGICMLTENVLDRQAGVIFFASWLSCGFYLVTGTRALPKV